MASTSMANTSHEGYITRALLDSLDVDGDPMFNDSLHHDPQKPHTHTSTHSAARANGAFGSGFNNSPKSFPIINNNNNNNPSMRHPPPQERGSFSSYPSASDVFPMTSPVQPQHQQLQSPPHSYASFGGTQRFNGSSVVPAPSSTYPTHGNGMHMSQTPYGPHIPSALNSNDRDRDAQLHQTQPTEEINTIFVVGFPSDFQEREFANMFTFAPGFEAATLKIPNKEYTAYGGAGAAPGGGGMRGSISFQNGFDSDPRNHPGIGVNDPYNLVTIAQGGVIVDGGRDGLTASWPNTISSSDDYSSSAAGGAQSSSLPPRKQIIGFAKFKSRGDALLARDGLQGRRVDIEKASVLKAEMAKKNLHTKRGVGPVNGVEGLMLSPPSRERSLMDTATPSGQRTADHIGYDNNPTPNPRWRENRGSSSSGHVLGLSSDEEDGMGIMHRRDPQIGMSRGPRERAEDDERRRNFEARLRSNSAFDAFHSVPGASAISRHPSNSLLSPTEGAPTGAAIWEDAGPWETAATAWGGDERAGPWKGSSSPTRGSFSPTFSMAPSGTSTRPVPSPSAGQLHELHHQSSPYHEQPSSHFKPISQPSSSSSSSQAGDEHVDAAFDGLALNTQPEDIADGAQAGGDTSPQLPSPSSGSSGGARANAVDSNPPINTLYVGNLPTSAVPLISPTYLEDALRDLFQRRPGFRKLCFRQKSNGPMCFVEFEDVSYATKTLNDLYGDTLNGLIKGGGIRLSYSKNPLGIRTPTSAGNSTGGSLQAQQLLTNGSSPFPVEAFQPRPSVDYQSGREYTNGYQSREYQTRPSAGFHSPEYGARSPEYGARALDYESGSRMRNGSVISPPGSSYGLASPPPRFFSPPLPMSSSAFGVGGVSVSSSFGGVGAGASSFNGGGGSSPFGPTSSSFGAMANTTNAFPRGSAQFGFDTTSPTLKANNAFSPFGNPFPSSHPSSIPNNSHQSASSSETLEHFHPQQ